MLSALKGSLMPFSVTFLLWALAAGLVLLYSGARPAKWARRWLVIVTIAYWLAAMPIVAAHLADWTSGGIPPATPASVAGAQAIVVLDGGAGHFDHGDLRFWTASRETALRALEAAHVSRLLDRPWVIVTGGDFGPPGPVAEGAPLRDALIQLGVAPDRVVLDSSSTSTRVSALTMKTALAERGITQFVLVTSASHMPRAMAAFREVGLTARAAPAPWHADSDRRWSSWTIVPSADALLLSQEATYELLGRAYYRARGWTGR